MKNNKVQIAKCKYEHDKSLNIKPRQSYYFSAMHFYSIISMNVYSFLLIPPVVSALCLGQSSNCKKMKKDKIRRGRVMVLMHCIMIYLPTKFLLISLVVSELCTGQEHADCRTDKAVTACSPFGEYKHWLGALGTL